MIVDDLESKGLILKKGTIVDATIVKSYNRPLSKKRREELSERPSTQIDTDAQSTKKNGKYYFGYKGHIGTDVGTKLIRTMSFTAANAHDSTQTGELICGDERSIFGDKAYADETVKHQARKDGVYYGILDKAKRGRQLTNKQVKRNKQLSKIRAKVEHPFAYMKRILNYEIATARTLTRNELRFIMNCVIYNVMRATFLIKVAA